MMEISKEDLKKIYIDNKIKFQMSIEKDLKKLLKNNNYFILDFQDIYSPYSPIKRVEGFLSSYKIIQNLEKEDGNFYTPSGYIIKPSLEITYLNSKGDYHTYTIDIETIKKFACDKNPDSVKLVFECSEDEYEVKEIEEFEF